MSSTERAGILGKFKCKETNTDFFLMVLGDEAGKWGFPKGHLEYSEDHLTCAQRECYEETGIDVKLNNQIGFKTSTTIYFLHNFNEIITPNPQDLQEVRSVKWFSVRELLGTNLEMFNSDSRHFIKMNLQNDDGFELVVNKKKPRPRQKICKYFIKGVCNRGEDCKFKH
jgi:8-oxo-dGTP pyrophosphatase MutT (NUDIX family)